MATNGLIRFRCSGCGKGIKAQPELVGKQLPCPNCKTLITIPLSSSASTISDEKFGDSLAEIIDTLPPPPPWKPTASSATDKTDEKVEPLQESTFIENEDPLAFLKVINEPTPQLKVSHTQPSQNTSTSASLPVTRYHTHGEYFFDCGPGYWRTRTSFVIFSIIGILLTFTGIFTFIGLCVLVSLFVIFLISRSDWRNQELQRVIEEASKSRQVETGAASHPNQSNNDNVKNVANSITDKTNAPVPAKVVDEKFKNCPYCGQQILATAIKCNYCNGQFYVISRLRQFVGQEEIKRTLNWKVDEVSKRGIHFPHTLFCGPPDSGKVTLASLMTRELGVSYQIAHASGLQQQCEIIPYLTNAEERSFLVIEDIDLMSEQVCNLIVPAVEDFCIDLTLGEGRDRQTLNMPLKPFTLIGTTSKPSRVNRELLSWLTVYSFKPYTDEEFSQIVRIMAFQSKLNLPAESIPLIVSCCEGSLEDASRLIKQLRGYGPLAPSNLKTTLGLLGYGGKRTSFVSLAEKINSMTGVEFEEFVAEVFQKQGYRVEFTEITGDHGIDLLLRKNKEQTVVQCKRWEGSVGEPIVRDFFGSMISCGADRGIIVTTAYFTQQAIAFASNKPITLMDMDSLLQIVQGVQ